MYSALLLLPKGALRGQDVHVVVVPGPGARGQRRLRQGQADGDGSQEMVETKLWADSMTCFALTLVQV